MHMQSIQLNERQQCLLKSCLDAQNRPQQVPAIPIAQFERYTFIKSLDFIRYRHNKKQKPQRYAKILPYMSQPVLAEMGMIQSAMHCSEKPLLGMPKLSLYAAGTKL